jgi:hypothetical protein
METLKKAYLVIRYYCLILERPQTLRYLGNDKIKSNILMQRFA